MPEKCTGHRPNGARCKRWPLRGATVCDSHGGGAPQVAAKAAIRHEVAQWFPGGTTEDPGEVLLRMVTVTSERVALYASLLEEQYQKAAAGDETTTLPARIGVLIGHKHALTRDGDAVPVEEAIRALVALEQQERALAGSLAAKAVSAGLEARRIDVAQRRGSEIAAVLQALVGDAGLALTAEQRLAFPAALRRVLGFASQPAIEGELL
jgi:hypothetical protein